MHAHHFQCLATRSGLPGCGEFGHVRRNCPSLCCVVCGKGGHAARDCPTKPAPLRDPILVKLTWTFVRRLYETSDNTYPLPKDPLPMYALPPPDPPMRMGPKRPRGLFE